MSSCEIRRISKICDLINQGLSYQEIEQRLKPLNCNEKGEQSVKNVKQAITSFPFIKEIRETVKNGEKDTVDKYDLILSLSGKSISEVGIQVKSDIKRISKFNHQFGDNSEEIEKHLIERKLIVINGQLSDQIIKNIFLYRLEKIDQYFMNQYCLPIH